MSDDGKKQPLGASFLSLAWSLFCGTILLILAVELAKKIWWLIVLIVVGAAVITVLRWIAVRKKRWNDQ